jgi:PucR C-terminal helix-turn-helix domain
VKLSELLAAVGSRTLRAEITDLDPVVSEVVLDDGRTTLGQHQVVLAVRPDREAELADECQAAGCEVIVVPSDVVIPQTQDGPVIAKTDTGWTQLFVLIRTMLLTSHDEIAEGDPGAPSSVHGLADAIAVMMGGTVVLYDRAHRVVAYSVQGQPIDDVRRDAILGRRTPEQWIRRFTIDRTAYQTYDNPGTVVKVAGYPDLRERLRIAVHASGEVIGEISVARGDSPFAEDADETLQRAAKMAVPAMLQHRKASDVDELSRARAIQTLLTEGVIPSPEHPAASALVKSARIALLGMRLTGPDRDVPESHPFVDERLAHFLSLHVRTLNSDAQVLHLRNTFYALLPDLVDAAGALKRLSKVLHKQMEGMKIQANIALAGRVKGIAELPSVKRLADDLLDVGAQSGHSRRTFTAEQDWASLVLLVSARSIGSTGVPCAPLERLRQFDTENKTDMVDTLRIYLESLGSVSTAAARLYLHGNTMRHRLARIAEVSGVDLDDPRQWLALGLMLAAKEHSA